MSTSGPLQDFIQETNRVLEFAKKRGITPRVMGACAIRVHCSTGMYSLKSNELAMDSCELGCKFLSVFNL